MVGIENSRKEWQRISRSVVWRINAGKERPKNNGGYMVGKEGQKGEKKGEQDCV